MLNREPMWLKYKAVKSIRISPYVSVLNREPMWLKFLASLAVASTGQPVSVLNREPMWLKSRVVVQFRPGFDSFSAQP